MTDKKKQNTPKEVTKLSEWQRRNQEYQKKKQLEEQEEKEKKAQEEKERQELLKEKAISEEQEIDEVALGMEDPEDQTEETDDDSEHVEWADQDDEETSEAEEEEGVEEKIIYISEIPEESSEEEVAKKSKKERLIAKRHIYRALPILVISTLVAIFSTYLMTPIAKQKVIEFSGNNNVDQNLLFKKSQIKDKDYTLTTFLNSEIYLANMKAASPWIKDISMHYAFPTTFKVQVTEYQVFGYYVTEEDHYPILENGEVVESQVASDQLASTYLIVRFSDRDLVRQFVKQMGKVSASIKEEIETVDLTPSKVTKDLVTLTMKDGTKVLVPISQIKRKLPYYHQIRQLVEDGSVIDMEAGIYSYNSETMATLAQEKKEKEQEEKSMKTEEGEESEESSTESEQSVAPLEGQETLPTE